MPSIDVNPFWFVLLRFYQCVIDFHDVPFTFTNFDFCDWSMMMSFKGCSYIHYVGSSLRCLMVVRLFMFAFVGIHFVSCSILWTSCVVCWCSFAHCVYINHFGYDFGCLIYGWYLHSLLFFSICICLHVWPSVWCCWFLFQCYVYRHHVGQCLICMRCLKCTSADSIVFFVWRCSHLWKYSCCCCWLSFELCLPIHHLGQL